ncbi:MAG: protein kinase [Planctomycetes bacterium]|nr:protein kinase [Planctomycetota bacterium]
MQLVCSQCHQQLEFTGSQPKFCSNCGQMLTASPPAATVDDIDAPTLPPRHDTGAEMHPPDLSIDATTDDVPQSVGPYRLGRRLGSGGMGTVYEAVDSSTGLRVALKLVQPEHSASKEAIDRFRQEGELASRLAHPRCVFVLAADEDQGRPYIVMELMTGSTLQDLVKRNGPLPQEQALAKILDVIEGLSEAHQLGLVHRDVKPSNCFLEENGRVKIGDFGLAKSLVREAHLTRTGTFLGTPLFAAPEQIRMEGVDVQSDVYSVAATLYYLLTGRAPFQTNDPIASMARIVADDPPSMRTLMPRLPKGLDKVVLRGLARDRKRRWRTLEDFRRALTPFLPAEPSVGGLGFRLIAYWIDALVLGAANWALGIALLMLMGISLQYIVTRDLMGIALNLMYFGILEGFWACSLGKRVLRLRVGSLGANRPPGFARAASRAAVLIVFLGLSSTVGEVIILIIAPEYLNLDSASVKVSITKDTVLPLAVSITLAAMGVFFYVGIGLILCTMRKRNGYRGLHEFISGTRTYRLHWPQLRKRRVLEAPEFRLEVEQPAGLPEQVGPYRIRGALSRSTQGQTLLADDVQLGRSVWIWMRTAEATPLSEARRSINRTTRVRWVACGTAEGRQWDAFLAPTGCPLPVLVASVRRLSWAEFREVLEELTEEMRASSALGTLPASLSTDQVWVKPGGRVQLVDAPVAKASVSGSPTETVTDNEQRRALTFLSEVAVLALEGTARPKGAKPSPIRAPLPVCAATILNRLMPQSTSESTAPYDCVESVQADLLAIQSEPVELTRWLRFKHLIGHGLFAFFGLGAIALLLTLPFVLLSEGSNEWSLGEAGDVVALVGGVTVGLVLFFLPSFLSRGGLSFLRAGIAIVTADGRRASRCRCLWRAVLAWGFLAGICTLAAVGIAVTADFPWFDLGIAGLAALLIVGYLLLMLRNPGRAPHDFVSGTYLVPK